MESVTTKMPDNGTYFPEHEHDFIVSQITIEADKWTGVYKQFAYAVCRKCGKIVKQEVDKQA